MKKLKKLKNIVIYSFFNRLLYYNNVPRLIKLDTKNNKKDSV